MTQFYSRTALLLLACSALGACTTYQPLSGEAGGEPLRPSFPTRLPPPPETVRPVQPPPPVREAPDTFPARPSSPVESRPLDAPAGSRPMTVTPSYVPPPGQAAPPPYTPPAYTPSSPPAMVTRTEVRRSVTGKVVDTEGPPRIYTVKKGDTLFAIARTLDTTSDDLAKDNKLKAPFRLQPGDKIKGPTTQAKAYVVGAGDTLFAIARRFSVTAAALAEANDISTGASLRPGRKLILPQGYKDKGPTKTEVKTQVPAPQPAYQPPPPRPPAAPYQAPQAPPTYPPYQPPPPRPPAAPYQAPQAPPTYQPYQPPPPPPYQPPATQQPTRPPATPPQTTPYNPQPAPYAPPPVQRPVVPSTTPPGGIVPSTGPLGDAQISQLGRGRFLWPLRGELISTFGPKGTGQRNDGINIRVAAGETIRAAAAGDVVYAGDQVPGFGNLVLVKHADGWVTAYGHLSRVDVKMQQKVAQGQQLGLSGSSGGVGEPQLHFEVRYAPTPSDRARPIDPQLVLPR